MQYLVLVLTIIAVIIIAKIFTWPLKKILKLLLNIGIGLVMILLVNVFGESIGLHIPNSWSNCTYSYKLYFLK